MEQGYWFTDKALYGRLLEGYGVAEEDYLSAIQEITDLFPPIGSARYFRERLEKYGGIGYTDLVPTPFWRLQHHPVWLLLGGPSNTHSLAQILYVGLALRDFKNEIGRTKAFRDLTQDEQYRGSLFEIETGAALARSGLKPLYSKATPDFFLKQLALGVEATICEVPAARSFAAQLMYSRLSFLDFESLSIELKTDAGCLSEDVANEIICEVETLLRAGRSYLQRGAYRIDLNSIKPSSTKPRGKGVFKAVFGPTGHKTLTIVFGIWAYEETLSGRIEKLLTEKEAAIQKRVFARSGITQITQCVVAIDIRSLTERAIEPESAYETALAERHKAYFDRLRLFRKEIERTCERFVAKSPFLRGVLLYERKRMRTLKDEVHSRYSMYLVSATSAIKVDYSNLASELRRIA